MRRQPSDFYGVRVETIDGNVIDPLMVRIDAAFRTAWIAMNQSIPRTRPEGFPFLRAEFLEACGLSEDDALTAARYFALCGFVQQFEAAERRPVAVNDCLEGVRQTIKAATKSGRFNGPTRPNLKLSLNKTEEAVLACPA